MRKIPLILCAVSLSFYASLSTSRLAKADTELKDVKKILSGSSIDGTPEISIYQLKNGLKVLILPDNRNAAASLRIILNAGSNREKPGTTGLAHFFEHMMFRKTQNAAEGTYDRTLSGVGGRGNASTSTDFVLYESLFPGPALDQILDLEAARFLNLDLKDPYFSTEKGAVISERRLRYENDPKARGNEIVQRVTDAGTPYEWLTIGSKADVEGMKISDAEAFYNAYYAPDNAMISIGGPFDEQEVLRKVVQRFAKWDRATKKENPQFPADYLTRNLGKDFICGEAVFEQTMQLVFPTSETTLKSHVFSSVLQTLLTNHPEGSLSYRLTKANLALGAQVYKVSWQKQFQPVQVYFRLTKEQSFKNAEEFLWKAIDEAKSRPIDEKFRKLLLKQHDVESASTAEKMSSLLEAYEWNTFFLDSPLAQQETRKLLAGLNEAEFRTWLNNTFDKKKFYREGVVPNSAATPCAQWEASLSQGGK